MCARRAHVVGDEMSPRGNGAHHVLCMRHRREMRAPLLCLSAALGLAGAPGHQLSHDPARRVYTHVCKHQRVGLPCPFRHGPLPELVVTLGEIGVAGFS